MKKTLISFAAFAFALTFTACGGKTEAPAENPDSAAQEVAEAEAPSSNFENEFFTVTAPEGWKVEEDGSSGVEMEDVNSTETFKPKIKIKVYTDKTLAEKEDYYLNHTKGTVKGADVTFGDLTFKTFRDNDSELYYCFAELEGGKLLELYTVYMEPEADAVKPVMETLKLK